MAKVEDFFSSLNRVDKLNDERYAHLEMLKRAIDAMANATYQSIYVIDYFKQEFLHVANNSLFLCGHSAEEVRQMGYRFYIEHVPLEEQAMLTEINEAGFEKFNNTPIAERNGCFMSYNFHIISGETCFLVNHKITPFAANDLPRRVQHRTPIKHNVMNHVPYCRATGITIKADIRAVTGVIRHRLHFPICDCAGFIGAKDLDIAGLWDFCGIFGQHSGTCHLAGVLGGYNSNDKRQTFGHRRNKYSQRQRNRTNGNKNHVAKVRKAMNIPMHKHDNHRNANRTGTANLAYAPGQVIKPDLQRGFFFADIGQGL